jgi:hypothetical protein
MREVFVLIAREFVSMLGHFDEILLMQISTNLQLEASF